MFDGSNFPKSLDDDLFNLWLENGRASNMSYHYLLIIWDRYDSKYQPVYADSRDRIAEYEKYGMSAGRESLVAAYDLYSESRVM
jgi:hypothetical protein